MGLIISIIVLLCIYMSQLPAANGIWEGHEHMRRMREESREHWRREAAKQDRYYCYEIGDMNPNFYSDGSLRRDMSTNRVYPKGTYYCDSDGVTANWRRVDSSVPRPPKD